MFFTPIYRMNDVLSHTPPAVPTPEGRCPVCGATEGDDQGFMFVDRYGHPDNFRLVKCRGYGHLMTMPRLMEGQLPSLYGTYCPQKALTSRMVTDQAAQAVGPMARLSNWWMDNDNRGAPCARWREDARHRLRQWSFLADRA